MEDTWIVQVDELQALESIWGDSFSIISAEGIPLPKENEGCEEPIRRPITPSLLYDANCPTGDWKITFQLCVDIHQHFNSGWPVAIENLVDSEKSSDVAEDTSENIGPVYQVCHLPPIHLYLTYTSEYPYYQAPDVRLSAIWLNKQQSTYLETRLMHHWEESGNGLPIVYIWTDWLQHSGVMELLENKEGCSDTGTLILRHDNVDCSGETFKRIENSFDSMLHIRESDGPDDKLSQYSSGSTTQLKFEEERLRLEKKLITMLRYDAAQKYRIFTQQTHVCGVCFDEVKGADFVRLDCRHFFCRSCVGEQARINVREGTLEGLKCPEPGCGVELGYNALRELLSSDDFDRWERLTLQRALDTMEDASYCPRCGMLSIEDPTDNCANCPKCFYVFCALCKEARHPGSACVSVETKLEILRCRANGGGTQAIQELRRKEHELLSLKEVEKSSKPCPSCGARIQRDQGCNKVVCSVCHSAMCWRCGEKILGYEHFRGASAKCVLFDEAEILRWERQMAAYDEHGAAAFRNDFFGFIAEMPADENLGEVNQQVREPLRPFNCPNCGQRNYKFNRNNHMHCWSCSKHFCACCKAILPRRGGGLHFGPGGCKQHT